MVCRRGWVVASNHIHAATTTARIGLSFQGKALNLLLQLADTRIGGGFPNSIDRWVKREIQVKFKTDNPWLPSVIEIGFVNKINLLTNAVEVMNAVLAVCVTGHHRAVVSTRVNLWFGSVFFRLDLQFLFCSTHKPQFGYFRAVPAG